MGVSKNLILTGPIEPALMPNVYADADLFVNASHSETFSMVTLEAIAAGLPAVVVNDEALQVMVAQGQNGFVGKDCRLPERCAVSGPNFP